MLMSPSSSPAALDEPRAPKARRTCTSSHKAARLVFEQRGERLTQHQRTGPRRTLDDYARFTEAQERVRIVSLGQARLRELAEWADFERKATWNWDPLAQEPRQPGTLASNGASDVDPFFTAERFERTEQTKGTHGHRAPSIRPGARSKRRFTAKDAIVPQEHFDAAGPTVERVVVRPGDHQMLVHHPLGL